MNARLQPGLFALILTSSASFGSLIPLENFESGLGSWTPNAVGNTGHYVHQVTLQPTDDTGTNFASGGTGAASLGKSGGIMLSPVFDLTGGGATESITFNWDHVWHNGTTTRRGDLELSLDGGSNWFRLATMQVGGSRVNKAVLSASVTVTEGTNGAAISGDILPQNAGTAYNGSAFTSTTVFRLTNRASAGADARIFVDNLEVLTTVTVIPEPGSFGLGLLGAVLVAGLRRRA